MTNLCWEICDTLIFFCVILQYDDSTFIELKRFWAFCFSRVWIEIKKNTRSHLHYSFKSDPSICLNSVRFFYGSWVRERITCFTKIIGPKLVHCSAHSLSQSKILSLVNEVLLISLYPAASNFYCPFFR